MEIIKENKYSEEKCNSLFLEAVEKKLNIIDFCQRVYTPTVEHFKQHVEVVKLSNSITKSNGKTNLYLTEHPIDKGSVEIIYAGMTMYYTVIVAGKKDTKEFSRKLAADGTRYYRRDVMNGHNTLLELLERCIWGKVKYAYMLYTYQQEHRIPFIFKGELLKSVGFFTSLVGEKVRKVYDCTLHDYKGYPMPWNKYRLIETFSGKQFIASNESGKYQIIKY